MNASVFTRLLCPVFPAGNLSQCCPLRLKSARCSLDSIIYAHSGPHILHCLTSYSWPIDGETLCASWWSLQRSLQRPYFHFKSPSYQDTEAGFLTWKHFHSSQWDLMFYRIFWSNMLYNTGANYLTVVWKKMCLAWYKVNMQWQAEKEIKSD